MDLFVDEVNKKLNVLAIIVANVYAICSPDRVLTCMRSFCKQFHFLRIFRSENPKLYDVTI
jgi:hypothetical protein